MRAPRPLSTVVAVRPRPRGVTAERYESGRGRTLDLASGTGQLAFPLCGRFAEVWHADAEPGMTEVVRAKATAAGAAHIRTVTAAAEDLRAEPGSFEMIVIGNRLRRALVAERAYAWLKPGGCLALC